jgi:hypothetical protein
MTMMKTGKGQIRKLFFDFVFAGPAVANNNLPASVLKIFWRHPVCPCETQGHSGPGYPLQVRPRTP